MIKTCGNCSAMIDEGDGCFFCAWRDLYYFVETETPGCKDWRSKDDTLCAGLAQYHADINRRLNNS